MEYVGLREEDVPVCCGRSCLDFWQAENVKPSRERTKYSAPSSIHVSREIGYPCIILGRVEILQVLQGKLFIGKSPNKGQSPLGSLSFFPRGPFRFQGLKWAVSHVSKTQMCE